MPNPNKPQPCAVNARAAFPLTLLLLITASGCAVGPDYHRPTTPVPDAWHHQIQSGEYLDAEGVKNWWTLFGDSTLDTLIARAKENNLDLYAASQRICQARQRLNVAKSARWPFIDNAGSYQNSVQSAAIFPPGLLGAGNLRTTNIWNLGFDVAWEPDLWGRIRRDVEANCATFQQTVENYRDSMVTLYSEVARNYVELRTLQSRLIYARQNVAIQKAALELADIRVDGGVSPVLDSHQATANLASTESEIPPIEQAIQASLNRLAVLLGEYPRSLHCDLLASSPIPTVPQTLPVALPCDVVRQRPDIRAAERNLAARTAEVGVATADLFPRFLINGSFNFSARTFSDVFSGSAYNYGVGPSFSWPLFHAGQIRAQIASTECGVSEALALYEQTLLVAAEEVENSIVSFNKEQERRDALARSVDASKMSLESVLEVYRAGNTDFQNVLDTQRTLFTAQNQLAASEGQVVVNLVAFYKALGGGWDPVHHCKERYVRVDCPPNCPVVGTPDPIDEPSYLVDDKDNEDDEEGEGKDEESKKEDNDDSGVDKEPRIEDEPTIEDESRLEREPRIEHEPTIEKESEDLQNLRERLERKLGDDLDDYQKGERTPENLRIGPDLNPSGGNSTGELPFETNLDDASAGRFKVSDLLRPTQKQEPQERTFFGKRLPWDNVQFSRD